MLTMAKDFRIAVLVCMVLSIVGRMAPATTYWCVLPIGRAPPNRRHRLLPEYHHSFRRIPTTFPTIWKLFSLFFTWIGAIAGFSG